jgi:predicted dehydrogenase
MAKSRKMKRYKWGILGPGRMASKFTKALQLLENVELYAVGSRDLERSKAFSKEYGFKKAFGSYEEMVADPELEIVYIATPHTFHKEHTLLCLRNGKNVICEKVFAMDSSEVTEMVNEARSRNLFLMEALWPNFQPYYNRAKEILDSGILGGIVHIDAFFSFIPPFDRLNRKWDISLGGGSLFDIGVYPVIDALTFIGVPDEISATAHFSPTGSEDSLHAIFKYNSSQTVTIYSSYRTNNGIGCNILCEKGNLIVSRGRDMKQRVIVDIFGEERHEYIFDPPALGYHWEGQEVMRCLEEGLKESPVVPLSFSLDLISTIDRIRESAQIPISKR